MWHQALYDLLLLACLVRAIRDGGAPERWGIGIVVVGSVATMATVSALRTRYAHVETGALVVDVLTLLAFLALALRANRMWPMYVAGLQAAGVTMHLFKAALPAEFRLGYAFGSIIWAYLMVAIIWRAIGRHRARLHASGVDPSWSSFSPRPTASARPRGPMP